MQQETLRARRRVTAGSRPARRLRREGLVPAVVYGRGLPSTPVAIDARELHAVLHGEAGLNAVINLEIEDEQPVLTVARELQRDPVRGVITHLDLIQVSLDEPIEAEVALEFIGTPFGVREEGGMVEVIETTVTVSALPTEIPTAIPIDIAELRVGDALKVGDLPEMAGVVYVSDPDHPLVTILAGSLAEAEEEAEEEAGEEAAATPAEEAGDDAGTA